MGIDIESARFLLQSRQAGVRFTRCLTLGRQHYFLGRRETRGLLRPFDVEKGAADRICGGLEESPYSEPFWQALGVEDLSTLDASDFEGATFVHDLNQPVPEELHASYDAVCDFGTIEHVFNFPTALASCMQLVKVGGRFITHTTANNFCGHGFYQFSPELFFRALGPANGFEVERMVAVEYGPCRRWFNVSDPETVRARVSLINSFPVLLFVQARRVAAIKPFASWPQQSDYLAMWQEHQPGKPGVSAGEAAPAGLGARLKSALLESMPRASRALQAIVTSSLNREYAWRNRRSFQKAHKTSTKP
ncbi:MAG: hypothetical protein H7A46_04465 [Verrucomicrobiales bacterium]|nr:hypothetical protein [Verrucomicrobiales bacterium]